VHNFNKFQQIVLILCKQQTTSWMQNNKCQLHLIGANFSLQNIWLTELKVLTLEDKAASFTATAALLHYSFKHGQSFAIHL